MALQKTSIFSANATSNQKFTLDEIASYYIDPIADADSANKWMLEYSSLEYNDFDKLLDMLTDKAVKRRKNKDQNEEDRIILSHSFRKDINKTSNKKYKKSYNQLSPEEYNGIMEELWSDTYKSQFESLSTLASCICAIFPLVTIPAGATLYNHCC